MYQVFCRSPRRGRPWTEYSGQCQEEEARVIKERAESQHYHDLYGNELLYKIKVVDSASAPPTKITRTVTELSARGVVCKAVFSPEDWRDDFIAVFSLGELTKQAINKIAEANETSCVFRY